MNFKFLHLAFCRFILYNLTLRRGLKWKFLCTFHIYRYTALDEYYIRVTVQRNKFLYNKNQLDALISSEMNNILEYVSTEYWEKSSIQCKMKMENENELRAERPNKKGRYSGICKKQKNGLAGSCDADGRKKDT